MKRRADAYLAKRVAQFERRCLIRILRCADGDMSQAARIAGRDRASFYGLLKRHGIDWRSFRPRRRQSTQQQQAQAAPTAKPAEASAKPREWFGISVAADR